MDRKTLEGMTAAQLKEVLREKGVEFNPKDGRDRLLSKGLKAYDIQVEKGFFARAKSAVKSVLGMGGTETGRIQSDEPNMTSGGRPITDDEVEQLANHFSTTVYRIRQEIGRNTTWEQVIADNRISSSYRREAAQILGLPY